MMSKIAIVLLAVILTVSLSTVPATAASSKTGKITSSKDVVIKVAGGTGYATSSQNLKKGTKVTLKVLSAGSKYAKTLAYGKAKGWSAKKVAKALRHPKAYKADTTKYTYYKAYKGQKLRYIVEVKKPAQKPAATQPPEKDPAAPAVSESVLSKVQIRIKSSDSEAYGSSVYALDGTLIAMESLDGDVHVATTAVGNTAFAAATFEVPKGSYEVWFPRPKQELVRGQSPYWYQEQTITVDATSTVIDVWLDPVPGRLIIDLTPETAAEVEEPSVILDGAEVAAPLETSIPAGVHEVELLDNGEVLKVEEVEVCPGAPTGVEL